MNRLLLAFVLLAHGSYAQRAYIGEITGKEHNIPIRFDALIHTQKKKIHLSIINSTDTILLEGIELVKNEYIFHFPVFNTHIRLKREKNSWSGTWTDRDKNEAYPLRLIPRSAADVRYPLSGHLRQQARFLIHFNRETTSERPAILEFFPHTSGQIKGSILTTAGDYRFLQGTVNSDSLILSTFDGKFAYVFAARILGDSIYGVQYAASGAPRTFSGHRDDNARLPDPESLTKITDPGQVIRFSLPDTDGNTIEFVGNRQPYKVTLITIGGSWCPNCMDEARFLNTLYHQYQNKGLHIIGVYFEYTDQQHIALPILKRMKEQLKLDFPILYGGSVRKQAAAQVFPQIEKVLAYPTLIAVDANGQIIKTYTGFYGPGTSLFKEYEQNMRQWLDDLLAD